MSGDCPIVRWCSAGYGTEFFEQPLFDFRQGHAQIIQTVRADDVSLQTRDSAIFTLGDAEGMTAADEQCDIGFLISMNDLGTFRNGG